jgi:hypothetical protein
MAQSLAAAGGFSVDGLVPAAPAGCTYEVVAYTS